MKAKIIPIGNSRGIRIPKQLLDHVGVQDEVLLEASRGTIVIRPMRGPRDGWAEAFKAMASAGDDTLIDLGPSSKWDQEEWEWK